MQVYLLVEEIATGTFADGTTYAVLSAHGTATGVKAAEKAWRFTHGEPPHAFSTAEGADAHWCAVCDSGVTVDQVGFRDAHRGRSA